MSTAFPNRPDHPDFERLSRIVHAMEKEVEGLSGDEWQAAWDAEVNKTIDLMSLVYFAHQRALRATQEGGDVVAQTQMFIDGFLMGARFASRVDTTLDATHRTSALGSQPSFIIKDESRHWEEGRE